jgi:hypothetical protein
MESDAVPDTAILRGAMSKENVELVRRGIRSVHTSYGDLE